MGSVGDQSVEARDVAEYSTMHRTASPLAPNRSSTQLRTLVSTVSAILLDASALSLLSATMLDVSICVLHPGLKKTGSMRR